MGALPVARAAPRKPRAAMRRGGGAEGAPGGSWRGQRAPGTAGASLRLSRRGGGGGGVEEAAVAAELETEGERQLKRLLRHQLDTAASLEECVAKRHRFAPATVYRPFGEEAAGARTLPEFRALQESSGEAASLQEQGLSDAEIRLWRQRAQKSSGLGAAPEATQDRIRAIQEKIAERQRILSLPQHFAGSKSLSRREMEIEKALFQGTDRHSFLRMLYRQDEGQAKVAPEAGPMAQLDAVYRELLSEPLPSQRPLEPPKSSQKVSDSSCSTPFGSLTATATAMEPVMVTERVACVPEEEILRSRLSKEEIRQIPRFSSYSPGEPSKVLYVKNLSRNATVKDLLPLFSRFQKKDGPPLCLRLLSGRMRGQAFLTFPTVSQAQEALELLNGFLLLGKPLILEFGRSRKRASTLGPGINSAFQENDGRSDKF